MCKYCNEEKPLFEKRFGDYGKFYTGIESIDGTYLIAISVCGDSYVSENAFGFGIKFCPMCGKKLGDD